MRRISSQITKKSLKVNDFFSKFLTKRLSEIRIKIKTKSINLKGNCTNLTSLNNSFAMESQYSRFIKNNPNIKKIESPCYRASHRPQATYNFKNSNQTILSISENSKNQSRRNKYKKHFSKYISVNINLSLIDSPHIGMNEIEKRLNSISNQINKQGMKEKENRIKNPPTKQKIKNSLSKSFVNYSNKYINNNKQKENQNKIQVNQNILNNEQNENKNKIQPNENHKIKINCIIPSIPEKENLHKERIALAENIINLLNRSNINAQKEIKEIQNIYLNIPETTKASLNAKK